MIVRCCKCGSEIKMPPSRAYRYDRVFCSQKCYRAAPVSIFERFWRKVTKTDSCWMWTGCVSTDGYGRIKLDKPSSLNRTTHKLSWEIANGPVPDGLFVLHKCDVRRCVNPEHLFLGTQQDNVDDMLSKGRNQRGSGHYMARRGGGKGEDNRASKLTEAQVLEIRARYKPRTVGVDVLAKDFGVSRSTVWLVIKRKLWDHI